MFRGDDVLGFVVVNGEAGALLAKLIPKNMGDCVFAADVLEERVVFDMRRTIIRRTPEVLPIGWTVAHQTE